MSYFRFAWDWLKTPAQWHGDYGIPHRLLQHLGYSGAALLVAAAVALPLGILIGHYGRGGFAVVNLANAWRAIPTLGLVILMAVLLRGSIWATLIPLIVLAIPPILVNAYEGVAGVDRDLTDAARGMGMTERQIMGRVEIPVALPIIMLGLRTGSIFIVATATIAAEIGSGGLGRYIIDGLATSNYGEVAGGAALVVVLALLIQFAFTGLRRLVVPAPLRERARADN